MFRDKLLQSLQMKKQEDVKKVIKAELNTDMEFDGETLEKILELGIRALGKNSAYSNILKQKQQMEQTIYKINDKNDFEKLSKKIDNINLQQTAQTQQLQKTTTNNLTFEKLYAEFVEKKRADNEVKITSYNSFRATFNFTKIFFKDKDLSTLNYKDQNTLKTYLQTTKSRGKLLSKVTINNHIQTLVSMFNFAEDAELLNKNFLKNIKQFKEDKIEKENYKDEQLLKILTTNKDKFYSYNMQRKPVFNYYNLFKICIFSGTRISEILKLKKENIKQDRFTVQDAKTKNGNRTIPIHLFLKKQDFMELIDNLKVKYTNEEEMQKEMLKHTKNANKILKKLDINLKEKQTFHTLRGTFMEKLINKDITKKVLVQMMVGHSIPEEDRLTLQTYVKKIDFELYQNLMEQFEIKNS